MAFSKRIIGGSHCLFYLEPKKNLQEFPARGLLAPFIQFK